MLANIIEAHTLEVSMDHDGVHMEYEDRKAIRHKTLRAHRRLVEIIISGDSEQAESFWRAHGGGVGALRDGGVHDPA